MTSTQDIRPASFAAVVFLYLQVTLTLIGCQNADISGCSDSQLGNSSLTLKCRYIGKRDVAAIYWYNGSNSDTLALIPDSNVSHCVVFSTIDISFDPHRISYTCNALNNVYTLTINPLQKLDNNVPWSCTFLDPAPNPVKAECIIQLSETTDVTAGDGRISSSINTVTIVMVCVSLIVAAVAIIILLRIKKRSPCKTSCRCTKEQNADVSLSLHKVPAEETEYHHESEPNSACTWHQEDSLTFYDSKVNNSLTLKEK